MKKLLFVLAFVFIGEQAFSQIYIATFTESSMSHSSGCLEYLLTKIDPVGNATYDCISSGEIGNSPIPLVELNLGLNSIVNQGYKLIEIIRPQVEGQSFQIGLSYGEFVMGSISYNIGTVWYFAVP